MYSISGFPLPIGHVCFWAVNRACAWGTKLSLFSTLQAGDASLHALCPKANASKCFCGRRTMPGVISD